jgi:hypothetical protein
MQRMAWYRIERKCLSWHDKEKDGKACHGKKSHGIAWKGKGMKGNQGNEMQGKDKHSLLTTK